MIQATYQFLAAATNGVASIGLITGPAGMTGKVTSVSAISSTAITGSGELSIGAAGLHGTIDIPATSLGDRVGGTFRPAYSEGGRTRINPDEVVDLNITSATTLGAADFFITVEWR
jgi:hypothetical protein